MASVRVDSWRNRLITWISNIGYGGGGSAVVEAVISDCGDDGGGVCLCVCVYA
jgi:hypothetical protein